MNNRHKMTEINCMVCGSPKMVRVQRVERGMGKFCSKKCYHEYERDIAKNTIWGRKDLATTYDMGKNFGVRWYDENGKTKSSTFAKWWWEMNVGEIPAGMLVLHKDNNPRNIDPTNFILGTKSDVLAKGNQTRKSNPRTWKTYIDKLRASHTGKIMSEESRKKMSDNHHTKRPGYVNPRWKGGNNHGYPKEWTKSLRNFIKSRDNYMCQVCGRDLRNNSHGHIHHISGNKQDCSYDNLVLVCIFCHNKIHASSPTSPEILRYRSLLEM